jgi:riboflavin synthase
VQQRRLNSEVNSRNGVVTTVLFSERVSIMTKLYEAETKAMDLLKMLADLRQEREHIEEAIVTLERLARGRGRRRGRPPAWMATIKRRGRPPGSKNKPKESAAA